MVSTRSASPENAPAGNDDALGLRYHLVQLLDLETRTVRQAVGVGDALPCAGIAKIGRQELELAGAQPVVLERLAVVLERHHAMQEAVLDAVHDREALRLRRRPRTLVDDAAEWPSAVAKVVLANRRDEVEACHARRAD